jgi:hypothetical protein
LPCNINNEISDYDQTKTSTTPKELQQECMEIFDVTAGNFITKIDNLKKKIMIINV